MLTEGPACLTRISRLEEGLNYLNKLAERSLGESAAVKLSFVYGVFLSTLAIATSGTLNRDGMLYVEAANAYLRGGIEAATAIFAWPFLSILMASIAQCTPLSIEQAGYLLNALFMGGTGALLVACAQRSFPRAAWATAIAFLVTPGINDYRHEIIREFGCWFFVMLGFWLAIRWQETGKQFLAWAAQCSIVLGALFRPEAMCFLVALILWQLSSPSVESRRKNLITITALPLLGASVLLTAFLLNQLPSQRLVSDLSRLNFQRVHDKAKLIADHLPDYAQPNALTILVFGSLALIPLKFVHAMGITLAPLATPFALGEHPRKILRASSLFSWAALINLLILCVFVTDLQFLPGRYVAQWTLFFIPLAGYGLFRLWQRYPRTRLLIVLLAVAVPLSNAINAPSPKMYFREAGNWLKNNAHRYENIYIEDGRTSYYAGLGLSAGHPPDDRAANEARLLAGEYDLIALHQPKAIALPPAWLNDRKFELLAAFPDKKGNAILIMSPRKISEKTRQ